MRINFLNLFSFTYQFVVTNYYQSCCVPYSALKLGGHMIQITNIIVTIYLVHGSFS